MTKKPISKDDIEKMLWDMNDTVRGHGLTMEHMKDRLAAIESSSVGIGRLELLLDMLVKRVDELTAKLEMSPLLKTKKPTFWRK